MAETDIGKGKDRRPAIYSRKSKYTGKGESIENQIGLCRRYVRSFMGEEAEREAYVYEDEGFSGGSLNRPMFRQMMRDARAGKISAVIVYRLDRISRNIGDFAGLIEELNRLGISFLSIREQFDTSSPMGRAMMYIASVFSQLERETIAERIRDNMQELAKTGRWLGGVTPIGYDSRCVSGPAKEGRERKLYCLEQNPEEARTVRQLFDLFISTGSLSKTEQELIRQGCVTRKGKSFSRFAIREILKNPVYAAADQELYAYLEERGAGLYSPRQDFDGEKGAIAYNRTVQKKGQPQKPADESDWIVAVGRHEGLVSGAKWVEAQRLLECNRSKSYRRPRSGENRSLLSGLLFCRECGARMRVKLTARRNCAGERRFFYLCTGKERGGTTLCGIKNAEGAALDECAVTALGDLPESLGVLVEALRQSRDEWRRDFGQQASGRERFLLERQLADAKREKRGILMALGECGADTAGKDKSRADGVSSLFHELEEACKRERELSERLERHSEAKRRPLSKREKEETCTFLLSFPDLATHMEAGEQRRALQRTADRIEWDGESVHFYALGAGPVPQREDSK